MCHETSYRLFAVVVHIGRGPNHGHYVAVVKSGGRWLLFDDEIVELVNEQVFLSSVCFIVKLDSRKMNFLLIVYFSLRCCS